MRQLQALDIVPVSGIAEIRLVRIPGDRLAETTAKTVPSSVGRNPPEPCAGLIDACKQSLYFARVGTDALLIKLNLNSHTHQVGNGTRGIAYRDFKTAPDVYDLAKNAIGNRRPRKATHGICHE